MTTQAYPRAFAALALLALSACASTAGSGIGRTLSANRLSTYEVDVPPHGHGSGIVLSNTDDGAYILTCSHVVHGEKNIEVSVLDEEGKPSTCRGVIAADDPGNDLAVIKVRCRFPQTVVLDRVDGVKMADKLYNVGYPFDFGEMYGEGYVHRPKFSGIVLTQNGPLVIKDAILAHIPDGAGTSGSGLYSVDGKLVGIMEGAYSKGDPTIGLTVRLVIPMSRVRPFLDANKIPYDAVDKK